MIGIIVVIAIGTYALLGGEVDPRALLTQSDDGSASSEQLADTDEDGLEDWEESLWNTDPNNPDSDDDGISDGDEVAEGTHPKIAGPNDQIDQRRIDAVYSQDAEAEQNVTREVWQDLLPYMASYVSVDDESKEVSQEHMDDLLDEVSERASTDRPERFERSDLNINSQATFEDLDEYFISYTQITGEYYSSTEMEQELTIMGQATANGEVDEEMLVGLEVVSNDYRAMANELLELSVPESLANIHLEVVNNYLGLSQATEDMAMLADDPVRAMAGLSRYQELMNINVEVTNGLGQEIGRQARILLESA